MLLQSADALNDSSQRVVVQSRVEKSLATKTARHEGPQSISSCSFVNLVPLWQDGLHHINPLRGLTPVGGSIRGRQLFRSLF